MAKHSHDIHYLLIVLVLAFFVVAVSVDNIDPSVTGNVVKSSAEKDFYMNFLRQTINDQKFQAVSVGNLLNPIDIGGINPWEDIELPSSGSNIGGKAIAVPKKEIQIIEKVQTPDCEWVNLDNEIYNRLKSLNGKSACKVEGYDSCMMTNQVTTSMYYASKDSSCKDMQIKETENKFGTCADQIKTVDYPCTTQSNNLGEPLKGDFEEREYTTVFCCN